MKILDIKIKKLANSLVPTNVSSKLRVKVAMNNVALDKAEQEFQRSFDEIKNNLLTEEYIETEQKYKEILEAKELTDEQKQVTETEEYKKFLAANRQIRDELSIAYKELSEQEYEVNFKPYTEQEFIEFADALPVDGGTKYKLSECKEYEISNDKLLNDIISILQ